METWKHGKMGEIGKIIVFVLCCSSPVDIGFGLVIIFLMNVSFKFSEPFPFCLFTDFVIDPRFTSNPFKYQQTLKVQEKEEIMNMWIQETQERQ